MFTVTVLFSLVGYSFCVDRIGRIAGKGGKLHFASVMLVTMLLIASYGFVGGVVMGMLIGLASTYVLKGAVLFFGGLYHLFSNFFKSGNNDSNQEKEEMNAQTAS